MTEDVAASEPALQTLVIVHRHAGFKLLLRLLARRLGPGAVRGFPPARTVAERRDATIADLLGPPHDCSVPAGSCPCALCAFNGAAAAHCLPAVASASRGPRVMVADAKVSARRWHATRRHACR